MNKFSELGLSREITDALETMGFDTPTPIQEQAIPKLLANDVDFIGLAQTGTGKTAAFGLPLLEKIDVQSREVQALILAPTRELCMQITQQCEMYAKNIKGMQILAVYGGANIATQMRTLRSKVHLIVATPGRLIDLIERKAAKIEDIKFVVLDEADEMLNMGFKEELDKILSFTPKEKKTWLFSATMPKEIKQIVHKYMTNPEEVTMSSNAVNQNITHRFVNLRIADKTEAIMRFLDLDQDMRGIIFCRTKAGTQELAEALKKEHYRAEALHGDMSQMQRERTMKLFKDHALQVLVATDVAARGIDVNDLTHVIHHTLPDDRSYYTHRSGRTARAGKKGISLALIAGGDARKMRDLERDLKIVFEKLSVPGAEELYALKTESWLTWLKAYDEPLHNPKLIEHAQDVLQEMSKEEIIARILNSELDKLKVDKSSKDLNLVGREPRSNDRGPRERRENGRSDRRSDSRERGERRGLGRKEGVQAGGREGSFRDRKPNVRRSEGEYVRFFVNLGSMDKVKKDDLVQFVSAQSGVPKKSFGEIDIKKQFSYFEVDAANWKKIMPAFKDLEIDGRELRVNRDA